jgi:uncharacterized protein (DUF1778 family)
MITSLSKNEMLRLRIDSATEELMEKARLYVNLDRSKFVRHSIREKAEAILAEHEKTVFSREDWQTFFNMIDEPFESTARMRKAAETYQDIVAEQ